MPVPLDFHVHPSTTEYLEGSLGSYLPDLQHHFRMEMRVRTVEEMAADFEGLRGVLLAWDAETFSRRPAVTNDFVVSVCRRYPDRSLPFGPVDPLKGEAAIVEARRAVHDLGVTGFKFHPAAQGFRPSDPRHFPLFEEIAGLRVPCLFHAGTTGLGAGTPGGSGIALAAVQPIQFDTLAATFPTLVIVCAHPAWPWQLEMNAVAAHKANLYIDLSGWAPRYFPPELTQELGRGLQDKALFGTDYPFILPERWLREFEAFDLPLDVKEKILWRNAERLLDLVD